MGYRWGYGGYGRQFGSSPSAHLIFAAAALAVLAVLFCIADTDSRAYATDPSCALVTDAGPTPGACRVESVRVTNAWTSHPRGGTYRHVRVALAGGTGAATLRGPAGDAVYRAAAPGDWVTIQTFRGRIVNVTDTGGSASTDGMPGWQRTQYFALAIFFAGLGLVSAVRILLSPSMGSPEAA